MKYSRMIECSHCRSPFRGSISKRYEARRGRKAYCTDECRDASKPTLLGRFLAHTRRLPDGCLECDLPVNDGGYPQMKVNGKFRKISHVAWFLHYGEWPPKEMHLHHRCHDRKVCAGGPACSHRRCAEWSHLELVTPEEHCTPERIHSTVAFVARSRARAAAITHCPKGHEYTKENTRMTLKGTRACRICERERTRQYKIKIRAGQFSGVGL